MSLIRATFSACTVFILAVLAHGAPALAWNDPATVEAAYYSSVCYSERSGDLNGQRVILLNSGSNHFVVYQQAFGELTLPIWGKAEIKGGHLKFRVQNRDGEILVFDGTITRDYIAGRFVRDDTSDKGRPDYHWQRLSADRRFTPDCRQAKPETKP